LIGGEEVGSNGVEEEVVAVVVGVVSAIVEH
jgi:hypothetical protein